VKSKNKVQLLSGNVEKALIKFTIPLIFGMLSMIIFNLVDAYFIGKLGTKELAALSFTFPVVLVVNSVVMGLGMGTASVISRAVGEGNINKVKRLATDSLLLSIVVVVLVSVLGILTVETVFGILGVKEEIMPYVKDYMSIWYLGSVFIVVPWIGNNSIRALGDTKTPVIILTIAAVTNAILDPFLIFGYGPFPELGVKGGALATVISRALTLIVALYVLIKREKIVSFEKVKVNEIIESWRKILYIGVPNIITRMIVPISSGVITKLISSHGTVAVAGYGVATKLEFFALTLASALAAAMGPFVGQNYGAKKIDRLKIGVSFSDKFSLISSVIIYLILAILAKPIALIFNDDILVVQVIKYYLWIVPISYGLQGIFLISSSILNSMNKPLHAFILAVVQMFIFYVPLTMIGSYMYGIKGIFIGIMVSYLFSGTCAYLTVKKVIQKEPI